MLAALTGLLVAFAVAFALACLDPVWGQRMTLREGWDALTKKEKMNEHD